MVHYLGHNRDVEYRVDKAMENLEQITAQLHQGLTGGCRLSPWLHNNIRTSEHPTT